MECYSGILSSVFGLTSVITGPKYNGKYLHSKIGELLGETRIHETLTNVVIPAFDVKLLQPAIFTTFQVLNSLVVSFYLCTSISWINSTLTNSRL